MDSGIPWSMYLYGEDLDLYLSRTEDPTLKTFWDENNVVQEYQDFPYERVKYINAFSTNVFLHHGGRSPYA